MLPGPGLPTAQMAGAASQETPRSYDPEASAMFAQVLLQEDAEMPQEGAAWVDSEGVDGMHGWALDAARWGAADAWSAAETSQRPGMVAVHGSVAVVGARLSLILI